MFAHKSTRRAAFGRGIVRTIILYLLLIAAPTLALAYIGLQSVRSQQHALSTLTAANRRLAAERLAGEIERQTLELATAALSDEQVRAAAIGLDSLSRSRLNERNAFDDGRRQHRIVDTFFVIQGSRLLHPSLRRTSPRAIDEHVAIEPPAVRSAVLATFRRAEEVESGSPDLAFERYKAAGEMATTPAVRAVAMVRAARCLAKLKRHSEARAAYLVVAKEYPDERDLFDRPYALVAAIAADDIARVEGLDEAGLLTPLHADLLAGRWELSFDQAEYFDDRLRAGAHSAAGGRARSALFDHLTLARTISERFQHHGVFRPNAVYANALPNGSGSVQLFYTALGQAGNEPTILGLSANLQMVREELAPRVAREISAEGLFTIVARSSASTGDAGSVASDFRAMFPFWSLAGSRVSAPVGTGVTPYAGMVAVVVGVLVLGVVLLMRDVSREREIGRLRTDLVNGVSHDLKTPLTVIRLYADTLRKLPQPADDERERYASIIVSESQRLGHLIENVLSASQIDRGLKKYRIEYGEIGPVVMHLMATYRQFLQERGFSVEVHVETDLPTVRLDAAAAGEAVLNLLENAVKYSGDVKHIAVRVRRAAEGVAVDVEDRGVGIPESECQRVFDQFYRRDEQIGAGGYGLGLFLVKHIVQAHGGRIGVESQPGRGSCFTLVFPSAEDERAEDGSLADRLHGALRNEQASAAPSSRPMNSHLPRA